MWRVAEVVARSTYLSVLSWSLERTAIFAASERKQLSRRCASIRTLTPLSRSLHSSRVAGTTGNHGNSCNTDYHSNHGNHGNQSGVETTGLFNKPLFNSPEGFYQATEIALREAKELVAQISAMVDRPCVEIVVRMDELSDVLCKVADLSECIRLVHPDPAVCEAAQNASLVLNNYVEELNTDVALHRSLSSFLKSEEFAKADKVTQRTTELLMHDFESSGIHLDKEKRQKIVKLNRQILQLSHKFMHNASLPTLVPRNQCPPTLLNHFRSHGDHVSIDHVPYHSRDPKLRSLSYQLYCADIPDQRKILAEMLDLRYKLSVLAGYPSFAHRTLKMCMVESPENAQEFLEALSEKIYPLAVDEGQEIQRFNPVAIDHQTPQSLNPWDVFLFTSEARKAYFPAKSSNLREYFSLENTLKGLGNLFHRLFGVNVDVVSANSGEVWDNSVIKLAFVHDTEGLLGFTYCDLFARDGKAITDCHFTIQGGREMSDGSYQTPVIAVCCNFQQGNTNDASLLSQHAVENLFHELGHALHSMLGRSRYQNVTGTRCSTDFAEVPSTLMEYFLNDPRVLESFARHYKTGCPIPGLHLSTFQLSGKLFPAFDMQMQTVYALTELLLHTKPLLQSSITCTEFAAELYCQYAPMQLSPGVTWLLRFNHLYGYGARYYSYLWSRAVSCLIWRRCFEQDPFSRESGSRLRRMLQYGGGLAPKTLVRDMLGFEPSIGDLVDSLYTDVQEHRQKLKDFVRGS